MNGPIFLAVPENGSAWAAETSQAYPSPALSRTQATLQLAGLLLIDLVAPMAKRPGSTTEMCNYLLILQYYFFFSNFTLACGIHQTNLVSHV